MSTTPPVPNQNSNQDYTPVKLKDGTMIKLKGKGLSSDQVAQGVAKFRAAQGQTVKPSIQPSASPLNPTEKAMPFSSGVASGMMLDPTKIAQQKTFGGQALEVGKQMGAGALDLAKSVAKDPLNIGNPIDAIVKGQESAYKKVHEGLKSGNHDLLMNGLGEAVGNLSMLLGGAKSAKEGLGVASTARDASFAAKDLTSKRAIVSAASHSALDALKDEHTAAINTAVKAEQQRIGGAVASLNTKDIAASPQGYVPKNLAISALDQAVLDKKAKVLLDKRMMPKVSQVRGLLEGHTSNLTFNDLKQVRGVVGDALGKATGVEKAVLGDYYSSLTKNLKGRAAHLGGLPEWEDYNTSTEKLAEHKEGLIPELTDSKTGLEYAKKIASEQNQGRLNNLTKDIGLPQDTFSKAIKDYKAIINFAKMTEGDSLTAKMANRLIALKQHPIAASLGGGAGVVAGKALGNAMGSPMAGSFIGLTLGAAFAHDLMSKYDAAKAIREIGGPSGVMGATRPPQAPPSSAAGSSPQNGPGGGGSPSPVAPPGNLPPAPPPITTPVSSARTTPSEARALAEAPKTTETPSKATESTVERRDPQRPVYNLMRQARIDDLRRIMKEQRKTGGDILEYAKAQAMLNDYLKHPEEARDAPLPSIKEMKRGGKPEKTMTREEAEAASAKRHEPQVTKAAPSEHGRTESVRKGMTKDAPEARKAKAAERIAARRKSGELGTSTSGGDVVSKAEAMRKSGGKISTGGVEDISMLESKLADLYPQLGGAKFVAKFKKALQGAIGKEAAENMDIYKGYLQDTIEKKMAEDAKHTAIESQIPGLKKD